MSQKLEIAVTAWRSDKPWHAETLCSQAKSAESMGFHSYWLPENHFGDERAIPSPLTLLAAAAACTDTIKLATTSYLIPIRHPIQAAEEVAVLDQLSGGRLILGLGRGAQDAVFDVFGLPSKEKRTRFRNNLEVMIKAWQGEPLYSDDQGREVCLAPLPMQRPHPPLWVAAFGPLALKQVGSLGLPYISSPIESLADLKINYQLHRAAATQAGQTLEQIVPVMRTILITDDKALVARTRERLARAAPSKLLQKDVDLDDWAIIGDRHFAQDRLHEYVEQLGITHLIGGGRLPPLEEREQLRSHELLLEIGVCIGN
jgi:alkanesulfonate monooxygenase SsuD/methylene tetrahydromethanopterin reductase-like flavin-dependent oxidoreductase (luciferase family)